MQLAVPSPWVSSCSEHEGRMLRCLCGAQRASLRCRHLILGMPFLQVGIQGSSSPIPAFILTKTATNLITSSGALPTSAVPALPFPLTLFASVEQNCCTSLPAQPKGKLVHLVSLAQLESFRDCVLDLL